MSFYSYGEEIRDFLETHADLIEKGDFDELYKQFPARVLRSSLTDCLINAGIDPLEYLTVVPSYYHSDPPKKDSYQGLLDFSTYPRIQKIETRALQDSSISELVISAQMEAVDQWAFRYCSNLKKVSIEGNPTMSKITFTNSSIEDLYAPNLTQALDLKSCPLKHITLGQIKEDSLIEMLQRVPTLEHITFLGTLDQWNSISKDFCPMKDLLVECSDGSVTQRALSIDYFEGKTTIPSLAFADRLDLTSVTIPSSVKIIDYSAFKGCKFLTQIDLGQIEALASNVFSDTAITEVILPKSLNFYSRDAFDGSSLKSFVVPEGSSLKQIALTINSSQLESLEVLSPILVNWNIDSDFTLTTVPGVKLAVNKGNYTHLKKIIFKGTKEEWLATASLAAEAPKRVIPVICIDGTTNWSE